MGRRKKAPPADMEAIPLMLSPSTRGQHGSMVTNQKLDSGDHSEEEDDLCWLNVVVDTDKRNKGVGLLATDALLLTLHYLQVFLVLQSLSLRWTWPEAWLSWSYWLFLINVDVWEFLKLHQSGVYKYVQNYYVPSAQVGVDYMYLVAAWGALLFLLLLIYIGCYVCFSQRKSPRLLVRLSVLKQVLVVGVQVLAIPVGLALLRLFHCTSADTVDVKNDLYCYKDSHWAYLVPTIVIFVLIFIIFPIWTILRTKEELLNMDDEQHEGYLQLKEMEYLHGLDIVWLTGNFFIFASFKKSGAHFRACHLIMQGILLVLYGALYQYPFVQVVVLNCTLFVMFVAFVILRPFRVQAYNIMLIINYLCLTFTCLLGSFKASYNIGSIQSPWLLPYYQFMTLAIVNGFWLFCVLVFFLYVVGRMTCCRGIHGLWPHTKFDRLSSESRKFVKGVIISRLLVEKTLGVHPMFAPIHEVARYIHIINSYCREAELIGDPLQNTLWDVLDELIAVHSKVAPRCLFAESTKDSIRRTATEFLSLMPMFVRRLAQREYDMILVKPVKKRLLLKLYCLSVFLKFRKVRRDHIQLTAPGVQRIWQKPSEEDSDPGYYEDMYPPREPVISHRTFNYDPNALIRFEDEFEDDSDDAMIEETEEWLQRHGVPGGQRSDPLSDWMTQLGLETERPDTVVSEFVLPSDFTIPGLSCLKPEVGHTSGVPHPLSRASTASLQPIQESSASTRPTSASQSALRPGSAASQSAFRPGSAASQSAPRPGSAASQSALRPGSAGSQSALRPGSAASQSALRPGSAASQASQSALRPGSAASQSALRPGSAANQSVHESIPGAIMDEVDLTPVGSRPGSGRP